jgi:diketogulonate reductase-like aldo/keto reductase
MEFRTLGKTGEKISTIGMGTWEIGATEPKERREQISALQLGLDLGINLIDTAEYYGRGLSESLVGEAIRERRDSVFVATKVWPNHFRHDDVIRACDQSLQRLGIRTVDLYQLHWPNPKVPIKETMSAMEELVRAGKVAHVGVSNFSVTETKAAQDSLTKSELVSNQVEYSLNSRDIEKDILPYCEREGMTVIAYSPLARGRLPLSKIPGEINKKYGFTPSQSALNWVTRNQNVIAIPKSASPKHAEENAKSVSIRFTEDEYERISAAF